MTSANLSTVGFNSTLSPVIKKATATLSDGSAVMIVPDTNSATAASVDTTGVAKVRVYKSNVARTTWTLNMTWTPATVFASTTFQAVMSMVLDSGNNMHVVWAGTDNSLNYVVNTYSAGVWTAGTKQIVSASNAVVRRWRAVDIDVAAGTSGTTATIAITAFEAKTTASLSAFTRLFCRKNDNVTWVNAFTEDQAGLSGGALTIKPGSEDTSITFNSVGVVANVVQLVMSYTRMTTTIDYGDNIRELTFNISTGAAATTLGIWSQFNKGVGSPYRRIWLYRMAGGMYQAAFVAGASQPQFSVARLTSGTYTNVPIDIIQSIGPRSAVANSAIYTASTPYNYVCSAFVDNQVVIAFITSNVPSYVSGAHNSVLNAVTFTYKLNTDPHVSRKDISSRTLDNNFVYQSAYYPIAIWGTGNNINTGGLHQFNFMTYIGQASSVYLPTAPIVRAITDVSFNAPTNASPNGVQAKDTPLLQVTSQAPVAYPLANGKLEWNIAADAGFTTSVHVITELDSAYRYMGSSTAAAAPLLTTKHQLSGIGVEKLFTGTWYIRSRVLSDLGSIGAWSLTTTFSVLHQPTAIPTSPLAGSVAAFYLPGVAFTWKFSDTETTDTQTAYQVQVYRYDTNSLIYDTTKITSPVTSTQIVIASTYKDIPLYWQVSVWDTDNTQGPYCNPVSFTLSDPPTATLTSPVDAGTVTSAAPTVTWNYSSVTGRAQNAYKVSIDPARFADIYARVTANGWGTSSSGGSYNILAGAASKFSTDGTWGNLLIGDVVGSFRAILDGDVVADSDISCRLGINVTAVGAPIAGKLMMRYVDINNYILIGPNFNADGTFAMNIQVLSGGAFVYALNDGGSSGAPNTYTAGTDINFRFRVTGQRIQCKTWALTANEPANWNLDTGVQSLVMVAAGQMGLFALQNTGVTNTTTVIRMTNLSVTDADPATRVTSGWITSALQQYQFSANVMTQNLWYVFRVEIQDTTGLLGNAKALDVAAWTPGAIAAYSILPTELYAQITWTNSAQDTDFNSWRVWRRYNVAANADMDTQNTRSTWVLLFETQDGTSTNFTYNDYLAPQGKNIDYVVTQTVERFGSLIDSAIGSFTTVVMPGDRYVFVPDVAIGSIASFEAKNVTADGYTDGIEQATLLVVDRGNQMQLGSATGIVGSLNIQLRDTVSAPGDKQFFIYLAKNRVGCYMKTPFGDVLYVKFAPPAVTRISGVGPADLSDLTMAYTQVYNTSITLTTRTS
jgi:hypothetical protein